MKVGQTFSSFAEFQEELARIKEGGSHPLRVFNSQTAKYYNRKRNPCQPSVNEDNFQLALGKTGRGAGVGAGDQWVKPGDGNREIT